MYKIYFKRKFADGREEIVPHSTAPDPATACAIYEGLIGQEDLGNEFAEVVMASSIQPLMYHRFQPPGQET